MKIFAAVFFMVFFLHADEIDRIDNIVNDISQLRSSYESCQKELTDEKEKNSVLRKEIASMEDLNARNKEPFVKEMEALKKELEESRKLLEQKEKEIKNLNSRIVNIETPNNRFPKLVMKEEAQKKDSNLTYFEATTFRLKDKSYIYDGVGGQKVDIWEKDTSFTSYIKKDGWIKITGYFTDRVWVPSNEKELWVQESAVKEH